MTAIHQGAGQRACLATYEEVLGGQAPPSKPYYSGNGKMWDKNKTQPPPGHRYTSARRVNQRGRGPGSAHLPKTDKSSAGVQCQACL